MALPSTGSLSIKSAAGAGRSISMEVDGNEFGSKGLALLGTNAGLSAPHSMLEFLGYVATPPPDPVDSVSAVQINTNDIEITWTDDVSGGTPLHYNIERDIDSGGWSYIGTENYPATTFIDGEASMMVGSTVKYRVTAENGAGAATPVESNNVFPS